MQLPGLKSEVKKLPKRVRSRLAEVVETELVGIHEGDFYDIESNRV